MNFRKLRQLAGWSQYRLSAETGIERSKLSLFENGHLFPRPWERDAIEKALLGAIAHRAGEVDEVLSTAEAMGTLG